MSDVAPGVERGEHELELAPAADEPPAQPARSAELARPRQS